MNDTIMRYVRNKGQKVGMLVGKYVSQNQAVVIGWSRCRAGDKFNREDGYGFANVNIGKPVPPSFLDTAKAFRVQCFLYFKEATSIQRVEAMDYPRMSKRGTVSIRAPRNSGHKEGCGYPNLECSCRGRARAFAHDHEG